MCQNVREQKVEKDAIIAVWTKNKDQQRKERGSIVVNKLNNVSKTKLHYRCKMDFITSLQQITFDKHLKCNE